MGDPLDVCATANARESIPDCPPRQEKSAGAVRAVHPVLERMRIPTLKRGISYHKAIFRGPRAFAPATFSAPPYGHHVADEYTPALLSNLGQHGRLCDGFSLAVGSVECGRGLPFGLTLSRNSPCRGRSRRITQALQANCGGPRRKSPADERASTRLRSGNRANRFDHRTG